MSMVGTVGDLVEQYTVNPDKAVPSTIRELAQADPVLCRQVTEAIKRKLYCSVPAEQRSALTLLETLVDSMDLTFQQIVNEKEFLSALEKIVTRDSSDLSTKTKVLIEKWVHKFADEQDILPNFALYHSRLVEQGLVEPLREQPTSDPTHLPDAQVMDHYLLNEAEGQDPDEFKAEVKETLKLFDEVYTTIKNRTAGPDEVSRREALISLAANLDRYSEQFGLWIEQLEPGPYMDEAMALNDRVTEALQKYKLLRSSALRNKEASSEDDDSSDDSSDDD